VNCSVMMTSVMYDMVHVQIVANGSTPFISYPHQRTPALNQTAMQGQVLDLIPYTRIGGDGSGLSNYQQIKVLGKSEHGRGRLLRASR
jgi:hypothetical protein